MSRYVSIGWPWSLSPLLLLMCDVGIVLRFVALSLNLRPLGVDAIDQFGRGVWQWTLCSNMASMGSSAARG